MDRSTAADGPQRRRMRRCVLAGALAAAGLALAGCQRSEGFKAMDVTGADFGKKLELADPDGRKRTLADFQGKTVLLFFGFTQCPDVCPTALTRATEVRTQLGADAQRLQVLFVTVDPARDTPPVLREYMAAFDPGYIGLRGTDDETAAAAREFRVFYSKVPTGQSYTMDHTAITYVIDERGQLRLAVPHGESAADLVSDLRKLWARLS